MEFRKAHLSEAEAVMRMYKSAVGSEFCVWSELYPGYFELNNDMAGGNLYVLTDGRTPAGAVSVELGDDLDTFDFWREKSGAMEFARVVIAPEYRGMGMSKQLICGIARELKNRGAAAIHIAAAVTNVPACRLYKSCGFEFMGEADIYGGRYYLCELVLRDAEIIR